MNNQLFVAYFDILGYGARLKNKTLLEEFDIQKKLVIDLKKLTIKCNVLNFSDTFILYSEKFSSIVQCSLLLMLLSSIREIPYLPVRGAISYGDFLFDKRTNVIIGKALREAYSLEAKQEWMGCSLADSCLNKSKETEEFNYFQQKGVLVEYDVPLKESKKERRYVINMESFVRIWGVKTKNMPITDPNFIKNLFINLGQNNGDILELNGFVNLKLNNTKSFFKHIEGIKNQFQE